MKELQLLARLNASLGYHAKSPDAVLSAILPASGRVEIADCDIDDVWRHECLHLLMQSRNLIHVVIGGRVENADYCPAEPLGARGDITAEPVVAHVGELAADTLLVIADA